MGYTLLIPLYCNQWGEARGVLSSYVFALYLDVLSIQLGSARVGYTGGNMVVDHPMFAHDICVFSPSISGLQCLPNICGDYATEHVAVVFFFAQKRIYNLLHQMFFLKGVRAQFVDQVKYLGMWINASPDIQRQVKSLYCAANKIRGTFD